MTAAFIAPDLARIPAELRALPRWVAWRAETRPGSSKPVKVPYRVDLPHARASSTDAESWGTYAQAEAAYLDGDRAGIGLVLDGTGDLAGVDIDSCRDVRSGAVDPRAIALLDSMGAGYVEVSPSGTGLRAFGYAPPLPTGAVGTFDGLKLELYSRGRYLTVTGQTIKCGPLTPLRGFCELADRIRAGSKVNAQTGKMERAAPDEHHAELLRRVKSGDVYHDSLRDLAASLVATGMQAGAVVNHLRALMDASDALQDDRWRARRGQIPGLVSSAAAKYAPKPDTTAQHGQASVGTTASDAARIEQLREQQRKRAQDIGDGTDGQPPLANILGLDEMLLNVVFISDGSRVAYRDRPQTALPLSEFKLHTRASETRVGKNHVPTADLWVQDPQRITTHTLTYRPGHREFTADPEGSPALNLWRDRPRLPSSATIAPFLQHVAYLVPEEPERERFLSWLAHIEQHPGVLPHTHYLMVTPQTGIGRNWLASLLARVWAGATRLGFDLVGALQSGFNGTLSRRLLVIVDELKAADTGYAAAHHAQALKAMLTTEHRTINPKFGRQHVEFNCARWLMLSQHYDALPLERADRRVIVITNPTERRPHDYYMRLYALLDNAEFVNAVAEWLAERNLKGFNPSEPAPLTASKQKAIEACISDIERALVELRTGTNAILMRSADVIDYLKGCGLHPPAGRALSAAYAAAGIVPCDRLITQEGRKHRVVLLQKAELYKSAEVGVLQDLLRHHS